MVTRTFNTVLGHREYLVHRAYWPASLVYLESHRVIRDSISKEITKKFGEIKGITPEFLLYSTHIYMHIVN